MLLRQKTTGATFTADNLDVFQWKWLVKGEHAVLLEAELKHRGFTDWNYAVGHKKAGKKKTWTDLKNELKAMEKQRVQLEFPDDVDKLFGAELGFDPQCDELEFERVEKAANKWIE